MKDIYLRISSLPYLDSRVNGPRIKLVNRMYCFLSSQTPDNFSGTAPEVKNRLWVDDLFAPRLISGCDSS